MTGISYPAKCDFLQFYDVDTNARTMQVLEILPIAIEDKFTKLYCFRIMNYRR